MTTYGAATNTYYYLKDKIGSVHALVNTNGTVVEQYKYTAWGDVTVLSSNGTVLASSSYGNRFTWQGREVSYSTGLMFFRSRYYSAPLGRWLSKDKIGISGGANLYEAFGNNSVNFTDPMGCRWGISEFGGLNTASKTGIAGIISAGVAGYLQFSVDMQGLFLKENALRAEIDSNRSTMSMLQNVIDSMGEANWGDGFGQVGLLGANLVPQGDVCKDRQSVRNLFESVRNTRGWGTAVQEGLTRLVTAGYNPEALPRNMHPRMRAELAKALLERQQAYNEFLVMQLNLR